MKAKILYGLIGLSLVAVAWAFPSMGWMTSAIVPLWEISLPVLDPPFEIPVAFPCPSLGVIWIFSVLFTGEIPQVYVLEWVDTGLPVQ